MTLALLEFHFMINLRMLLPPLLLKSQNSRFDLQFTIHFIYNALNWYPLCLNHSPQDLIFISILAQLKSEKRKAKRKRQSAREMLLFRLPYCLLDELGFDFIKRRFHRFDLTNAHINGVVRVFFVFSLVLWCFFSLLLQTTLNVYEENSMK